MGTSIISMTPQLKEYFGPHCPNWVIVDLSKFSEKEKGTSGLFFPQAKRIKINSNPWSEEVGYLPTTGTEAMIYMGESIAHEIHHYCQLNSVKGDVAAFNALFADRGDLNTAELEAESVAVNMPTELKIWLAKRVK